MKKLSCIIVDDEPVARKILQEFVEQVHFWICRANLKTQ